MRTYLSVPYEDKDAAKALGAYWDPDKNQWYAPHSLKPDVIQQLVTRWPELPAITELKGEDTTFGGNTLFIDLTPTRANNIRFCIKPVDWERIRTFAYKRAKHQCECCGARPNPLKAKLPETTTTIELAEQPTPDNVDANYGFTLLGASRKQVSEALLSFEKNSTVHHYLGETIRQAYLLYQSTQGKQGLKPDDMATWEEKQKQYQASLQITNTYSFYKTQQPSEAEKNLLGFCRRQQAFIAYVKRLSEPDSDLPLTYAVALNYAVNKAKVNVNIWEINNPGNPQRLCLKDYRKLKEASRTVNLLYRSDKAQLSLLTSPTPTTEKIQLEPHERWQFNEETKKQKLMRIIVLCNHCHEATQLGRDGIQQRGDQARAHLMKVTGMTKEQSEEHILSAYFLQAYRKTIEWSLDLSIITQSGIQLTEQYLAQKNIVLNDDSSINQTDTTTDVCYWSRESNNKYSNDTIHGGKWMLFFQSHEVNAAWEKVKQGIKDGHLWDAKVSNSTLNNSHVIIIYTRNYTDKADVIRVLDYLESSGIKAKNSRPIYYKTDEQTRQGIYAGGSEKPWIYSSATIRQNTLNSNHSSTSTITFIPKNKAQTSLFSRQLGSVNNSSCLNNDGSSFSNRWGLNLSNFRQHDAIITDNDKPLSLLSNKKRKSEEDDIKEESETKNQKPEGGNKKLKYN